MISDANRAGAGFEPLFASLSIFDVGLNLVVSSDVTTAQVGHLQAGDCLTPQQTGYLDINYCAWSASSTTITLLGDGFLDHNISDLSVEFVAEAGNQQVEGVIVTLSHCNWIEVRA